ncbi:MAG: hypothetical protein EOO08_02980 [Chitinophagaceae bacterium]|nr:MAG: hypothetical protein EOO08_02980 [Chitinophagaceae bacterium]
MKTALAFLALAIGFLIFIGIAGAFVITAKTVDVHVYDTYLVIDRFSALLLGGLFLLTLFALGGLIGHGLRSGFFWILFLFALLCWGGLALYVFRT